MTSTTAKPANRSTNKRTAKRTPTAKQTPPAAKQAKPTPSNCACGCGAPTITAKAAFLPGHDARLAGVLGRLLANTPLGKDREAVTTRINALSPALKAKTLKIADTEAKRLARKAAQEAARKAAKEAFDAAMSA